METFDFYHVDPTTSIGDTTGRRSRNFVRFSPMLRPIEWVDGISRALRGKPASTIGKRLLAEFDAVGSLDPRWGTEADLNEVRKCIGLFGQKIDSNPGISPIGRFLLATIMSGQLQNRAQAIAFYEKNRAFIEASGHYDAPVQHRFKFGAKGRAYRQDSPFCQQIRECRRGAGPSRN